MKVLPLILNTLFILILGTSCVKKKLFVNEQMTRKGAEGQVTALSKELFDRKRETSTLIKDVGDLNRKIGGMEQEMADLQSELAKRTERMGASTEKLMAEKHDIEVRYNAVAKTLENKEAELKALSDQQNALNSILSSDYGALESALMGTGSNVIMSQQQDHIEITVSDVILFGQDPTKLGTSAPAFLTPFSKFLGERPAYKIQVQAHVDNQIPIKNKDITDTWSFSQVRALAIVRALVSNYNVNAYMLAPVARGEFQPTGSNSTPEGRATNRRTVFYIYTK
jgi:flagellar motor protein MotB